jgi:hypothetical protein
MKKKREKALTLIEVLITVFITVAIVSGVLSLYTMHFRAYQESEEIGEIVQNGRVILERLSREIRQAEDIVFYIGGEITEWPTASWPVIKENASEEIMFEDGHVPSIEEQASVQGAEQNTITLAGTSPGSDEDDHYKGTFVKIISGDGAGQIKEIIEYDSDNKKATIRGTWSTPIPNTGSDYRIDSNYYYVRYFVDATNNLRRQVITYSFDDDPNIYVPWGTKNIVGEDEIFPVERTIDNQKVGEYIESLKFWDSPVINIELILEKGDQVSDWYTRVYGRNL